LPCISISEKGRLLVVAIDGDCSQSIASLARRGGLKELTGEDTFQSPPSLFAVAHSQTAGRNKRTLLGRGGHRALLKYGGFEVQRAMAVNTVVATSKEAGI
jgi:hypothetical protein